MSLCSDLTSFADGELDSARAAAFRDHLRTCDACQAGLLEALQLSARLSTIEPESTRRKAGAHAIKAAAHAVASTAHSGPGALARRWKRIAQWGTGVLVTSGVAIAVMWPLRPTNVFAEQKSRLREIRFAYADASGHRPLRDPTRGAGNSSDDTQRIPFAAIGALEDRGDKHGVAVARAWNGDKPTDVIDELSKLTQTDSIRSDRAALEVVATSNDNLQPVLAELEALMKSHDAAAARAARWNYALVLSRLGLPLSATAAFRDIAAAHEPGWAEEASERATQQTQLADTFSSTWERADKAGKALEDGGPPVQDELVAARPGVVRAYFYSAVRTAATPERVHSLAQMAAVLDRVGGPQQRTLSRYVEQVARADFSRRAPLARAFADLLAHKAVPEPLIKELTTETDSADIADIVMGAMFERDLVADHRAWFHRMADRADDGWFELVLARATAEAEVRSGNVEAAEALLRDAASRCRPDITFQCLKLDRARAKLYADLDRVNESQTILQTALGTARGAGEWGEYRSLLALLTDVERFHAATAKVRAYADEVLRMGDVNTPNHDCRFRDTINRLLASAAILDIDGRRARQHFADARSCSKPTLAQALLLTDIARLDPRPDDLDELRSMLGIVRASGKLTAGEQLLADETEGRLLIELDQSSGVALLRSTIVAAERKIAAEKEAAPKNMAQTVFATKARAAAFAVLAFDAARVADHARVLELIARDLGLSALGNCTVGMVAEDERAAVVVRDATGRDRSKYFRNRRPSAGALTVPDELADGLVSCAHVKVMAPGALQGQPGVLPPKLAWSYASGVPVHTTAVDPPVPPRTLIVTDVEPPAYLELAPLAISPPHGVPATTLSRLEATPSRVIAAMPDASEIQFHTHALMNLAISDAIHLVLTPERSGGPYALTAEAIRKVELRAHPLVVLAACRSAKGATYQHQPWSLPDAFLTAGARAVFATATDIPDRQSGQFFARLLERVRSGVEPAVALRDLRIETLPTQPWVADVILVE
jgi:cellulose synthase operon protein C